MKLYLNKKPSKKKLSDKKIKKYELSELKKIHQLEQELYDLRKNEFIKNHTSKFDFFIINLGMGFLRGFGTVIGATLGVAIFVFLLLQLKMIPGVGDIVSFLVEQVKLHADLSNL